MENSLAALENFNGIVSDPEQRKRHALALSEELAQFERPQPVMDEYDLPLATEVIQ